MAIPMPVKLALSWIFLSFELIIIALRAWVCRRQRMRFKVADFLIMIAFVFVVVELAVLTVLDVLEMKAEKLVDPNNLYQTLFPLTALNDKDWSRYMKINLVLCLSFYTVVWVAKGAFLGMYYSLGEALSKPMRRVLWIGIVFTILTYVAVVLLTLLYCQPLSVIWTIRNPSDPKFCYDGEPAALAHHSAANLSTDLFILIYSLVVVRSLHLQHRELAGFAFVVAVGSASIIMGVVKVAIIFPTAHDTHSLRTWRQKAQIVSKVEQCTAVVACCLPAFRIYLRSAKSRSAAAASSGGWNEESRFTGGAGGRSRSKGFGASGGVVELTSFQGSTGGILADKEREAQADRDSEAQTTDDGR